MAVANNDNEAELIADLLLAEAGSEDDEEYPAYSETRIDRRERDREKLLEAMNPDQLTTLTVSQLGAESMSMLMDGALDHVMKSCGMWDCECECVRLRIRRGLSLREIEEHIRVTEKRGVVTGTGCNRERIRKCLLRLLPRIYNHPTFWLYQVIAEECHLPPTLIKVICEEE